MLDEVIAWRRDFHRYPELEFAVHQTAGKVESLLKSFGLEVYSNIGKTGLVGVLKCGDSARAIGLRADMDALPIVERNAYPYRSTNDGIMHACGHDGHMAMLLGAACYLSTRRRFNGTVYFIFQPNEERGLGAQAMIDDGLFERFQMDAVYGMHNMPGLPAGSIHLKSGPIMAAEDNFKIRIKGQGGHSSQPHNSTCPIVIGASIVNMLQTIVSRSLDPLQSAVVSVTDFKTNGSTNVIADEVLITGDCRSFDERIQKKIEQRMHDIVASCCAAYGVEFDFEYLNLFYPTINQHHAYQAARGAAMKVLPSESVNDACQALTASEDFSSMLRVKPGAYVLIGNGVESKGGCVLHNAHYDFNDDILPIGINFWVALIEQELAA